jgi:hypothetical protein
MLSLSRSGLLPIHCGSFAHPPDPIFNDGLAFRIVRLVNPDLFTFDTQSSASVIPP